MREIPLANGRGVALVDDEDYERLSAHAWRLHTMGYANTYAKVNGKSRCVLMHRLVMNVVDEPRSVQVDHINGVKLDNRRGNLRLCTHSQNLAWSKSPSNKRSSRFRGVYRRRDCDRWMAQITTGTQANGRRGSKNLGLFESEEDAARAYDAAARARFGEFARLNFPDEQPAAAAQERAA